ncbi:MAG: hypothetical protein HQK96_00335 [Nitrospirae bacterium]|nr:hypothetical protein [Nitrospirota bacterium]
MNKSQKIKNPLIISTGIYRLANEKEPNYVNNILEFYADHEALVDIIDGVELNIRTPEIMETLILSDKSTNFLQSLNHNTLHYFYFSFFTFNQDNQLSPKDFEYIDKLKSINDKIHFRSVVIHPFPYNEKEVLMLYKIFHDKLDIPVFNFESMLRDIDINNTDFERLFVDENIGLLLDASHAVAAHTSNSLYTFEYLKPFFDRISYLHISSTRRDLAYYDNTGFFCPSKGHSMFIETNSEDLILFDKVFEFIENKPFLGLILEQCIKEKDIGPLIKEIHFIKKHFLQI